ncbi:bcl-2 homologous antagonist/killer [Bombina bombina]|uniref:bcl-2 homologous antagonist/killer n=1 Tax=Bombina bombina TaxID=8345 RepID=UPI00235B08DA|nr:bcl-2 homologous antagonist/killer [Bombina bombina]
MASGGRDGPLDHGPDIEVDEEQMREQTEVVFLSYSFHMSQMETVNEDPARLNPEIEEIRPCDRMLDRVGQQLATIGDDINNRYEEEFNNILRTLNPNLENAYDYFKKIASSLFDSGINWGRILTLLGFGYRMAVYVFQNGQHGFFRTIAQWLARYVVESSIARWIAREGGWVAALKLTNNSIKYVVVTFCIVLSIQFLLQRLC